MDGCNRVRELYRQTVLQVNAPTPAAADVPGSSASSTSVDADEQALANCTRWIDGADGRFAQSHLGITGMWCAACAPTVEMALRGVAGVSDARVSAAAARAVVHWDPGQASLHDLLAAVRRAGYVAMPDGVAAPREQRLRESRLALWRFFVAAFCSMQVMMFLTPSYVSGPGELEDDMRRLLAWGAWTMSLPVLAFSAAPLFAGAWRALRHRRIGMDVPVALGLVVTFLASTAAMVDPRGPFGSEVYFDSLTMFVAFLLGARWFETRARHRAAAWLEDAAQRLPDTARRVRDDGAVESVAAYRLRVGERLRVPMGERFAADGVLVEGSTEVDEAILTGESRPVVKPPGSDVLAGSINLGPSVDMRVRAVGADTRQAGIVALMREAALQRPEIARLADRWAVPFLWVVLLLAAGSALAWSLIEPSRAVWVAVSVLIVTCPCALSLAVPSAQLAATGFLARRGLLLRRVDALESLARIDRVVFDKTGTLTRGREALALHVVEGDPEDADAAREAWRIAMALAGASTHPASRAISEAARSMSFEAGDESCCRDVLEKVGQGLLGFDDRRRCWRLGSHRWVTGGGASGESGSESVRDASVADDEALAPVAWLSDGVRVWRFVGGAERLRPGAHALGKALGDAGVELAVLSGDDAAHVDGVARRVGASHVVAGAGPESKLAWLRAWQREGLTVAMVGDGVNDAPGIAQADVSIAMGDGAAVTRSQADAVMVGDDLSVLPLAIVHARRSLRVVRQNLAWAAAYNLACIPLAMTGWLPPWAAGLGMAASSLAVIAHAQRLAR